MPGQRNERPMTTRFLFAALAALCGGLSAQVNQIPRRGAAARRR